MKCSPVGFHKMRYINFVVYTIDLLYIHIQLCMWYWLKQMKNMILIKVKNKETDIIIFVSSIELFFVLLLKKKRNNSTSIHVCSTRYQPNVLVHVDV